MSDFFPPDSFSRTPDLRLREVPEWGCLLVYTPSRPNVHYLDARSWLIFELCDGRTYEEVRREFAEAVPPGTGEAAVSGALDTGLRSLLDNGIVVRHPAPAVAEPQIVGSSLAG